MGTRGFIGFVVDGREKIAYNHFDSYPEGLGAQALTWVRAASQDMETLRQQVRGLRMVTDADEPTQEDADRLEPWTDLRVGERSADSWYCLLRRTQGDPGAMLLAGVIEDACGFPADSLFAEWGYVVDLDAETFEVYKGFQKEPHDKGRFADRKSDAIETTYYPVALVATWPLNDLPSDDVFVKTFQSDDD